VDVAYTRGGAADESILCRKGGDAAYSQIILSLVITRPTALCLKNDTDVTRYNFNAH